MNNQNMKQTTTRSQLQKSNLLGGGRLWENDETMDKKRIKGLRGVTSWHNTAKSLRLSPVGKSDVCVVKQRVVRLATRPGLSPCGLGTYLGTKRSGDGQPFEGCHEGVSAANHIPLVEKMKGSRRM